jgi:hypothetical protein
VDPRVRLMKDLPPGLPMVQAKVGVSHYGFACIKIEMPLRPETRRRNSGGSSRSFAP